MGLGRRRARRDRSRVCAGLRPPEGGDRSRSRPRASRSTRPRAGLSPSTSAGPCPLPTGARSCSAPRPGPGGAAGAAMLWVRPLESLTARPLAGTEGATSDVPVWSPDGRSLGFRCRGRAAQTQSARRDGTEDLRHAGRRERRHRLEHRGHVPLSRGGGSDGSIYSVTATGGDARRLAALGASGADPSRTPSSFLDAPPLPVPDRGRRRRGPAVRASARGAGRSGDLAWPGGRPVSAAGHLLFVLDGLWRRPVRREALWLSGGPVAVGRPWRHGSGPAFAVVRRLARGHSRVLVRSRREQPGPACLGRSKGRADRDGRGAGGLRPAHPLARRPERGPRGPGEQRSRTSG